MAFVFRFGKYAGVSIEAVPGDYLEWMRAKNLEMNSVIEQELARREALEESQAPMIEKVITAGWKALAQKYHPDKGGDPEDFKRLQAAYEQLKVVIREAKTVA